MVVLAERRAPPDKGRDDRETHHRECDERLPGRRACPVIRWFHGLTIGRRATQPSPNDRQSYKRLPRRTKPSDTFTSHPASPPCDPEGGRDTIRDFIIRFGDLFD
jgi:hypothetical protein